MTPGYVLGGVATGIHGLVVFGLDFAYAAITGSINTIVGPWEKAWDKRDRDSWDSGIIG
jgi:hypothetical protein